MNPSVICQRTNDLSDNTKPNDIQPDAYVDFIEDCTDLSNDIFNDEPELHTICKECLKELSPAEQLIFLKYAYRGSVRKLAKDLNSSYASLKTYIHRCKTKLRLCIKDKLKCS